MAYRRSIIQLKPDCDPLDFIIMVRLQQNYADGRTVKHDNVPTTDGASIEETLYCLREFFEAATALTFDTGNKLFNNFRRTL
jgi:hypothetical protein